MITLANAIYGAKHKQLHQVWNNLPCQQILHCWFRVHFEQIEPERGRHTLRIASGRCWQVALKHLSSSLSAFEPFALGLLIVTVDLRYWWGCEDTAELRWPLTSLYMSYRDTDWAVICCKKLWFHISLLWWLSLQRWMRNVQLYNHVILLYQPKPYETSSWTDYILIQSKTATRILKYKCFERINSPWLFTVMSELEASWTRTWTASGPPRKYRMLPQTHFLSTPKKAQKTAHLLFWLLLLLLRSHQWNDLNFPHCEPN